MLLTLTFFVFHSLMIHLGSQFDGSHQFIGRLSQVQLWGRVLLFDQEFAELGAYTRKFADPLEWPEWYLADLIVDWDWGAFEGASGVLKVFDSLRGLPVCPPGKTYDVATEQCSGPGQLGFTINVLYPRVLWKLYDDSYHRSCFCLPGKSGPVTADCPEDILIKIEGQYTTVSWMEPTFTDIDGTTVGALGNYIASGGHTLSLLLKLKVKQDGNFVNWMIQLFSHIRQ